ncbi:cyclic nucleotide-binding domain-containing protein [Leptobacterium flavescens]|uniref:Cyclic nucleotide-binding domain-containing protein n=1 Tax=Leptobacterium flavescens TaxID=472055 RepID=A0A6P0UL02_9FLAO|nr:Crp/Fnr family transcriptional regulator [Leptobacterium flavescens]NER13955.1 cyclic nucleotide-binding domain-containing protein [Leptobacterium flavescens]
MNTLTKYWFLEGFNLFNKLGRIHMMRICKILEMENIDKGCTINFNSREKDCVFFLKKGTIKIENSEDKTVKFIVKKGNVFGELALFKDNNSNEEQAVALEDCIICYIEAEQMNELMQKHKSLKNGILKAYGFRIQKLERRLQDLLYKDSATRISEFIINYVQEFGETEGNRMIAKNLLTHKDIAHLTNTSRQTVNNVLSNLRKQEVIDYDTKTISILKVDD